MNNPNPDKQTVVGGNITNVFLGTSFERIVVYICITIVICTWLCI